MPTEVNQKITTNFNELVWAKLLAILEEIKNLIIVIVERDKQEDYDGIVETYSYTATTNATTLWPPLDKNLKRPKWLWVQIINDSETTSIYVGVNEGSASALEVKPLESQKIQFGNKKKIEFINFKTNSGTAPIRIICAR